jgi:hypothetical protein
MSEHSHESYDPMSLVSGEDEYCGQLTASDRAEAVRLAMESGPSVSFLPLGKQAKLSQLGMEVLGDAPHLHRPQ